MIREDLLSVTTNIAEQYERLQKVGVLDLKVDDILRDSLVSWSSIKDMLEANIGFLKIKEEALIIEPKNFGKWDPKVIHYEAKSGIVKGDRDSFVTYRFPFSVGGSTLQLQYGPTLPGTGYYLRSEVCNLIESREIKVISGSESEASEFPPGTLVTINFSKIRLTIAPIPGIWYNTVSWFQLAGVGSDPSCPISLTDINTASHAIRDKFSTSFNPPLDIYHGDSHPWYYKEIPSRINSCYERFFLYPWFEYYYDKNGSVLDIIVGIFPYMVHKTYSNAIFKDLWTKDEITSLIERLVNRDSKGKMTTKRWMNFLNKIVFKNDVLAKIKCNCMVGYSNVFNLWLPDAYGSVTPLDMSVLIPKSAL